MNKTASFSLLNPDAHRQACGPSVVAPVSSQAPSFATMTKRRRPAKSGAIAVGFAWFDREQWVLLRDVAVDRAKLDDTFEEWETNARQALADLKCQGVAAEPFEVRVADLAR